MSDTKQLAFSAAQIDAILAAAQRCSNRNLLDNPDFRNPVNQRGVGGTISTPGYFIDRWKLVSGAITITANGLTLNGTIRQIRENSVGQTTTASVDMHSGTAETSYNDITKYFDIISSGGTIARCKLEVGAVNTLPNDPPADFGEELRKCQRYFLRIKSSENYEYMAPVGMSDGTPTLILNIPTPTAMRTKPTVSFSNLRVNGIWQDVTSLAVCGKTNASINVAVSVASGLVANTPYVISGNPLGIIDLSADL